MTSSHRIRAIVVVAVLITTGIVADRLRAQQQYPMCQPPVSGCETVSCKIGSGVCTNKKPYFAHTMAPITYTPCGPGPTNNCLNVLSEACTMTFYDGDMQLPCKTVVCAMTSEVVGCGN